MRIADKMQYEQVRGNLTKNRAELSQLQNQTATQKRVVKPSDDPLAVARILADRSDLMGSEQLAKNISLSKSFLDYTDQALGELTDNLVRAKELALSQANDGGATPTSRRVIATEVAQLYQQAVQIGNRKLGDRFLFGGFKTTADPFTFEGEYKGDSGEMMIQVNKDAFVAANVPGNRVFLGEGLSRDGFAAKKAKVPTTAEELEQSREREQQLPQALDEGQQPPSSFHGPASVRQPHGGAHATEELSSEAVGADAKATSHLKGVNIFEALKTLEIGLRTDHKYTVQESLDQLDDAISQVIQARAQVGSRIMTLDNNFSSLQKDAVDVKSSISGLEDADTFSLVSDISKNQNTLQATLATSGKLIQPSLLDFLK